MDNKLKNSRFLLPELVSLKEKLRETEEKLRKTEDLLEEAIGHLDYCGYGDTWERQVAQALKEKLTNWERGRNEQAK